MSHTHSAFSDQDPLLEFRTGCPTPRHSPTSGLSPASASWLAARASCAAGSVFVTSFFGASPPSAVKAIDRPVTMERNRVTEAIMAPTSYDEPQIQTF